MRLPRFLWVPFELGRPFGAPNTPDFQRRVLREALALLERTDGPVVLEDFPDDAPTRDDEEEVPWACPISFVPKPSDESGIVVAVRREVGQLQPWAELAPPPAPTTGLTMIAMVDHLADITDGDNDDIDVERMRLVADDLRSWYHHAAAQQPGRASSADRNRWFWRDTALAHLLGQIAAELIEHPDPMVRMVADRAIVPRDHWGFLVPDPREDSFDG